MYAVVWEYAVKPDGLDAFLEAYGADGVWVRLFKRGEGYLGSELFRSAGEAHRFITIDRWRSRDVFAEFMVKFGEAYAALDRKCGDWTTAELRLGEIEA